MLEGLKDRRKHVRQKGRRTKNCCRIKKQTLPDGLEKNGTSPTTNQNAVPDDTEDGERAFSAYARVLHVDDKYARAAIASDANERTSGTVLSLFAERARRTSGTLSNAKIYNARARNRFGRRNIRV